MLVLALMLLLGGGSGFEVALGEWWLLRIVIPTLGIAAAVPWIITVWWTHDDLSTVGRVVEAATDESVDPDHPETVMEASGELHDSPSRQGGPPPAGSPQHPNQLRPLLDAWGASSGAQEPWQPS